MCGRTLGRSALLAALLAAALAPPAVAARSSTATREAPPREVGLPIGRVAPAFTLMDQHGRAVSLDSLLMKGPVALVFSRSADWCLYCKMQLVQLQRNLGEIEATGGQLVAVSYDSVSALKRFADRRTITFPLLSDVGSKTIDAYDVRSNAAPGQVVGTARHATFIIDQRGIIRAKLFQLSYEERPAVETLLHALSEARSLNEGTTP